MTSPSPDQGGPQPPQIEPDPALVVEFLTQKLSAAEREAAGTWAVLQQTHREKQTAYAAYEQLEQEVRALEAENVQLRAERDALRAELNGRREAETSPIEAPKTPAKEKLSARH